MHPFEDVQGYAGFTAAIVAYVRPASRCSHSLVCAPTAFSPLLFSAAEQPSVFSLRKNTLYAKPRAGREVKMLECS